MNILIGYAEIVQKDYLIPLRQQFLLSIRGIAVGVLK